MKLELHAKGITMTDNLREFIERKLHYALGRFQDRVHSVKVYLTDINGPRGGEDIQCNIQASLGRAGHITIKETREDPFSAVARASERANQRLASRLQRFRDKRRRAS